MRRSIVVALSLVCACRSAPTVRPEAEAPALPAEDMAVISQSLTDSSVKLTGTVKAGSENLVVEKASYEFVVDGQVVKQGEQPLNLSVAAGATADFALEQSFTYVKDADELKAMDARGGSLLLAIRGDLVLKVTTPAFNELPAETREEKLPVARSKEVRTPRLPHVKVVDFEAGRFSESEVQAVFHVGVVNPNPFPVVINGLTTQVQLAGKQVVDGKQGAGDKIAPSSTGVFDVTATMNEETHGKDVKKVIQSKIVPYAVTGKLDTALYSETLESKGDIKLNVSK
jgi:LEA14-like dessication related protein